MRWGISLVITTLNEESNISKLLDSLANQTKKASEIIIIDAGSNDKTTTLIKAFPLKIKLIVKKDISRSRARNLGVRLAKNDVIAMTDAGCVAKKDWLEKIIQPFKTKKVDVVAGFYDMQAKTSLQLAMAVFLGVLPNEFSNKFLPSTRSIAFTKRAWKKVGGFPEKLKGAGEDSVFAKKIVEKGLILTQVKNARVEWEMPENIKTFFKKIIAYAKGDAQSKIIWNPAKGITSHNIKIILVLLRYMVWLGLLIASFFYQLPYFLLMVSFCWYLIYVFTKVYFKVGKLKVALIGVGLQLVVDVGVMVGFIRGIISL